MKNFRILLIVLFCGISAVLDAQVFNVNRHDLQHKGGIESAVFHDGKYYCLDGFYSVFTIDPSDNLNETDIADGYIKERDNNDDEYFVRLLIQDNVLCALTNKDKLYRFDGKNFKRLKGRKYKEIFYEDDDYLVSRSCSGEWGGSAYFTDKKSKKKYECAATCPIIINKLDNCYYLTTTLGHLIGFTKILKIDNPTLLQPFKGRKGKESISEKGVTVLTEKSFALTITSFAYNNTLYHIVSKASDYNTDERCTSICTIENHRFEEVTKLFIDGLDPYEYGNISVNEGGMTVVFSTYDTSGFLQIRDNNIDIYITQKK